MTRRLAHEVGARRSGGAAQLLLCLATLAALFAMHGPSSDHMLDAPGHDVATSMAAMHGTIGGDDAMPPSVNDTRRTDRHWALMTRDTRSSSAPDGAAHSMRHADCLATLRSTTAHASPLLGAATPLDAAQPGTSAAVGSATQRGPPRPSLDRLCISRT